MALGGRIVLMKDGEVVRIGQFEEIVARPATEYGERFVEHIDLSAVMRAAHSDAKNPIRNDLITVGGLDFSSGMAAHGNVVSGEVTDKIADPIGPFTAAPYVGYSACYKDEAAFKTSERFILGSAWTPTADPNP